MSTYLPYYEEDERRYNRLDEELNSVDLEEACKEMAEEDNRIERLIATVTCHQCLGEGQTAYGRCECMEEEKLSMRHEFVDGKCGECGEVVYDCINFTKPQNASKEWAKLFLANWNLAVRLWDNGCLFDEEFCGYSTPLEQRLYAQVCCSWLIPNGFVVPHCVAQGE